MVGPELIWIVEDDLLVSLPHQQLVGRAEGSDSIRACTWAWRIQSDPHLNNKRLSWKCKQVSFVEFSNKYNIVGKSLESSSFSALGRIIKPQVKLLHDLNMSYEIRRVLILNGLGRDDERVHLGHPLLRVVAQTVAGETRLKHWNIKNKDYES